MSYDIGTAHGVIELAYNGRGVDQAQEDLDGINRSGGEATKVMDKASKGFLVGGAAIAGGLALGINAAANFEQRMAAVNAVSGASESQLKALSDKALQLGKDTAFSATEAASAIEELVKAGLPIEDVLNGAADATVALAAAGEIALPEAATIASNAMNQFNLAAKDLPNVADKIAGAANASAIDVGDFGQSLQQVGAVANLAGISFDDTAAAIALMGNAGIKGSDAGTSLKSMLANLQPKTEAATTAMEELGLWTKESGNQFYDAQGNLKSMAEISGMLQGSLKGLTTEQKQSALQTIFGSDAIRAAAILSNNGAKGFTKMADAMGKTKAADVAAKRMDNVKGQMEQMQGSLETAGIAAGQVFLPMVSGMVDVLTNVLNAFLNLDGGVQKFIIISAAVVGAVALIIGGLIKFVMFINKVRAAIVILRAAAVPAWLATLGPILLVVAAIALVVGIIVLLWKKNEKFRDIVKGVWSAIKSAVSSVVDWFKGLPGVFEDVWSSIKDGLNAVLNFIKDHWRLLISILLGPLGIIIALVTKFWPQITGVFKAGINVITGIWKAFWDTFGGIITAAFGLIVAIVKLGLAILMFVIFSAFNLIKAFIGLVWNGIVTVFKYVWGVILGVIKFYVNLVKTIITTVFNTLKGIVQTIWNGIVNVIKAVWGVIGGFVMNRLNNIKNNVSAVFNAIKGIAKATWNGIKNAISTAIDGIKAVVGKVKDIVTGPFKDAATWLKDIGKKIIQGLLDGIEETIHKVTDKLKGLTKLIPKVKGPESVDKRLLRPNGVMIMQSLVDGFDAMQPDVIASLGGITASIAPAAAAAVPASMASRPTGGAAGDSAGLRLVGGELRLDESGRAFIKGVAQSAIDDGYDFNAAYGRMG